VRWQAPELLDPGLTGDMHNSVFSDVYAFACVCYEVKTIVLKHIPSDTVTDILE
jgi:hypothetical protein